MNLEPKPISETAIEGQVRHIFPHHMNALDGIFGGHLLSWADELAGMVAFNHIQGPCLMMRMESNFIDSVRAGENLISAASINRTWNTSLEVGIKCWAYAPITGKRRHVFSAYCVLVGLDQNRRPTAIPQAFIENDDQQRRFQAADRRRTLRLAQRKK